MWAGGVGTESQLDRSAAEQHESGPSTYSGPHSSCGILLPLSPARDESLLVHLQTPRGC